jgi:hypothetical protein
MPEGTEENQMPNMALLRGTYSLKDKQPVLIIEDLSTAMFWLGRYRF